MGYIKYGGLNRQPFTPATKGKRFKLTGEPDIDFFLKKHNAAIPKGSKRKGWSDAARAAALEARRNHTSPKGTPGRNLHSKSDAPVSLLRGAKRLKAPRFR